MARTWEECEDACAKTLRTIVAETQADIKEVMGLLCARIAADATLAPHLRHLKQRSPWLWLRGGTSAPKGDRNSASPPHEDARVTPAGAVEAPRGRIVVVAKQRVVLAGEVLFCEQPFAVVGQREAGLDGQVPAGLRIRLLEVCPWTLSLALITLLGVRSLPDAEREGVVSLETHIHDMASQRLVQCMCQAALVAVCLEASALGGIPVHEAAWELLLMLARCHTNSIAITALQRATPTSPADVGCGAVAHELHCVLGAALYPQVSLINHSCAPTATVDFAGATAALRATTKLRGGEEVTISYGPLAARMPVAERRKYLRERYCFDCQCRSCVDETGAQPLPWACVNSTCAGRLMPVPGQRSASCTGCGDTVEAVTVDALRKELHSAREMLRTADQNVCTLPSAMRQTEVALSILRRVLHRNEQEIGSTADRLACLFATSGRWEEASNACALSVEVVSYCFGESALETALERSKLAKLLHNAGNKVECVEQAYAAAKVLKHSSSLEDRLHEMEELLAACGLPTGGARPSE